MVEIKEYWCNDKPTLKDIKKAFEETTPDKYIRISWFVKYNGNHSRFITWDITQKISPEEYYEKYIPRMYGM